LLVFILLLTTAGFTSLHHECIAHVQSCCANGETPVQKGCDNGVPRAGQVPVINGSCHTNTVLGTATRTPALVPKDIKSIGLKYLVPAVLASVFNPPELAVNPHQRNRQFSATPRTTLDKYLLNSSLLI
jgi:hypothetical protein